MIVDEIITLNDIEVELLSEFMIEVAKGKRAELIIKSMCAGICKRADKEGQFTLKLDQRRLVNSSKEI